MAAPNLGDPPGVHFLKPMKTICQPLKPYLGLSRLIQTRGNMTIGCTVVICAIVLSSCADPRLDNLNAPGVPSGHAPRITPLDARQLESFVPEAFADLPKTSSNFEKVGNDRFVDNVATTEIHGASVSTIDAVYGDAAGKHVRLEICDSAGMSMLMLSGWVAVPGAREDDSAIERSQTVNGRRVYEKQAKQGGAIEYVVVLGNRFLVSAEARGVDLGALRSAVESLDLAKLESMKGAGVQN
jgi:hypothetical protein